MSTTGPLLPIRGWLALFLALGLLAAAALGLGRYTGSETSRQTLAASVELAIPKRPSITSPSVLGQRSSVAGRSVGANGDGPNAGGPAVDGLANPAFTQPETVDIKPAPPDLDLVEASPSGPLPRISGDGRYPLLTYGRPFDRSDRRPKIAIMMVGLGPQTDATNATFHLPAAVSLAFSPYTEDLPSLFERARLAGHEVLLELPMEPADYPTNDPGPHTLRTSGTVDANIERLTWVLSRAPGYFAVTGPSGAFGGSPEATPVIRAIAAKGVGMIEIDGDDLGARSEEIGLAYTSTLNWIDETPSLEAIDRALADLEDQAVAQGTAIGIAEAYPITLQRLVEWTAVLEDRGIVLVPVSAVLIERNGLLGANDDSSGSDLAQSQN
jgi:polysaccharide deacetylase 2 family uncharacterized protein YibQ